MVGQIEPRRPDSGMFNFTQTTLHFISFLPPFGVKLHSGFTICTDSAQQTMPSFQKYLKPLLWLIVAIFSVFQVSGKGSDLVKKSLRQVKEGNLNDAYKSLETARQKKTDDFGIDYVYSIYFLSPYQKTLKLDSSYIFCLSAIEKFRKEDAEGKQKYVKLQIDSAELFSRKDYLDSLGFSQAERLESEAAYQYFLEKFPQSTRAETARQKRASLAFQQAKQQNSFDAFMAFLDKYPDAGEARSAKEISDLLVFENTAKKGKISDWEAFIEKNPNNPYVIKAQNRLYELATLYHQSESYLQFIGNYPANPNVGKAWEWIFFLDKASKSMYQMSVAYEGFPLLRFETRFRNRDEYLITFIERGKFGLMRGKGAIFIQPKFDSIPEDYRCELTRANFVKTFYKHKVTIFSMDSIPVSDGEYDNAEWFSDGILKVFKGGKQGLISLSGYQILGARYESIVRLTQNLLSIQQGSRYFLFSTKGQKIDIPGLDEVFSAGSYIACRMGEKFALVSENDLLKSLLNEDPELEFKYTSIEKTGHEKLILFQKEEVNYLSGNKVMVVKAKTGSQIDECPWGILVSKGDAVNVTDSNGNALPKDFEAIRIHGNLAVARQQGKFGLIDRQGKTFVEFGFDSISLLLRSSFLARRGTKKYLIFESGKKIYFSGNRQPEVLRYTTPKGIFASYFLVLTDSIDRKAVFTRQGKQILPYAYDQITLLDQHLFSVVQDKKVGIADTNGSLLIKPSLSGASAIIRDFICVTKGKQFTILNPYTKKAVVSNLTGIAKNFGNSRSLFVVRIQDKAGLIDLAGKYIVPCQYEEVMYWNPTRCLVRKNGFWYFYMLESGKELVKAMKSIRVLMERDNETIYEVEADKKVGIESTLRGEIAPTDQDEIIPFDAPNGMYFFAGRRVQQSSVYNLSYIGQNGELIKTQLLTEDEYEDILCD